jgi:hypothetical protein
MKHSHPAGVLLRHASIAALAALLVACGGGGEEEPKPAPVKKVTRQKQVENDAQAIAAADEKRMANAVSTGKTTAPVDLKFDLPAKPDVGQPFVVELAFMPRLPADVLEVEVAGNPGLALVDGGTARFDDVQSGSRHVLAVQARAEAAGLYYLTVVARMVNKVQTEVRTFSVPVAVGAVPAARKPTPALDASGQPIQSMPAKESGGSVEPKE